MTAALMLLCCFAAPLLPLFCFVLFVPCITAIHSLFIASFTAFLVLVCTK